MRKLIKVTKRHINMGVESDADSCPVALALMESNPDIECASVWGGSTSFDFMDGQTSSVEMPRSVQRFVNKFDDKGKKAVKPFNFYVDLD